MITAREDIRIAKADAFESIHALWQARSTANDASGDESRALLDPSRAPMYEQAFRTKSEALLNQPGSTYPLPPFYKRLFNGIDPVISEEDKFKVHAERIGDYTISICS